MTPRNGKKGKVTEMGCLWERTCGHCKNLFEAVTVGVCEVTDHRVEKTGDDEFAKSCPHYENKWGYADERESSSGFKQLDEAIRRAFDEFKKEFGEDAKLENGDEFVTVLNNAVLIVSLENGTLKTNFIGGAPFRVNMTLDIFEGSDEE